MKTVSHQNFGILIAYILPGSVGLAGICLVSKTVMTWATGSGSFAPTVSGFLYATLASLGLGIFANSLRCLTLDKLHQATGIKKHVWDYRILQQNISAVEFFDRQPISTSSVSRKHDAH